MSAFVPAGPPGVAVTVAALVVLVGLVLIAGITATVLAASAAGRRKPAVPDAPGPQQDREVIDPRVQHGIRPGPSRTRP